MIARPGHASRWRSASSSRSAAGAAAALHAGQGAGLRRLGRLATAGRHLHLQPRGHRPPGPGRPSACVVEYRWIGRHRRVIRRDERVSPVCASAAARARPRRSARITRVAGSPPDRARALQSHGRATPAALAAGAVRGLPQRSARRRARAGDASPASPRGDRARARVQRPALQRRRRDHRSDRALRRRRRTASLIAP